MPIMEGSLMAGPDSDHQREICISAGRFSGRGSGRYFVFLAPVVFEVPACSGGPGRDLERRFRDQHRRREKEMSKLERPFLGDAPLDETSGRPLTIPIVDEPNLENIGRGGANSQLPQRPNWPCTTYPKHKRINSDYTKAISRRYVPDTSNHATSP